MVWELFAGCLGVGKRVAFGVEGVEPHFDFAKDWIKEGVEAFGFVVLEVYEGNKNIIDEEKEEEGSECKEDLE